VIEFPETAWNEWKIIHDAANAEIELRQRIRRGTKVEAELEIIRVRHEAKILLEQELNADMTPVLKMMTGAEYLIRPQAAQARPDLIDGAVKDDGVCVVIGPSGSGKTTLVLQMLHSLNAGVDWLGQKVVPIKGSVGFLSYDQSSSITFGWLKASGFDMNKVSLVDAYKTGNPLGVPEMRKKIAKVWKQMGVEVVVLDSFSASFFGQDQNDAAATMHHYRDLKLFALTEVAARSLIVLAHSTTNNTTKARGSTVHIEVADSIMAVEGTGSESRKIQMTKYRAEIGQRQMDPVIVTAPDPVTHLVDLDAGEMALAGMHLPSSVAAGQMFPELPDTHADPDTDKDSEEDDDL
jgi:KaiC/GvpD/RAD55 family RecA-like ATPase